MQSKFVGLMVIFLVVITESYCCVVIKEESQAKDCLNIANGSVPLPINLTSQILNSNYICNTTKPLYTFFCTLYSTDMIWYFNGIRVSTFQNGDPIGRLFQTTYPRPPDMPVYEITTVLTKIDQRSATAPYCISTLTVQPFDDDNITVIPFNVSCHTHCLDADHTEICESVQYDIAAQPEKPKNLTGSVNRIASDSKVSFVVASINWNPSVDNATTVVSYNLTLSSNNSDLNYMYAPLLNYSSYTELVMEEDYTVSVSAVDLCGQVSEPATLKIKVNTSLPTSPRRSQMEAVAALSFFFVFTFIIMTGVIIIMIVVTLCGITQCKKTANLYSKFN